MVPEKLNRGRHTVDPKKLANWKKKLKKNDMTFDDLFTLVKAKIINDDDLQEVLKKLLIKE